MAKYLGFEWHQRKSGDVVVNREGKTVAILRGRSADRFLEAVERDDPQMVMAKVTGNYKRGNERR